MYFCRAVAIIIRFLSWNDNILWVADFEKVVGIAPGGQLFRRLSIAASTDPVAWRVLIISSGEILWGAMCFCTSRAIVAKLGGRKNKRFTNSALSEVLSFVAVRPFDCAMAVCVFCFHNPSASAFSAGKNLQQQTRVRCHKSSFLTQFILFLKVDIPQREMGIRRE